MSAPIALFCFRRPDHLARTLTALAANDGARDHDLIAFCDGPRHAGDVAGVDAVLQLLADWRGRGAFRSFAIEAQTANHGLADSIIAGVTRLCAEAGRVIVVEDDLVTAPGFLRYLGDGLRCYADDAAVASIHGYVYPVDGTLPETFFMAGADCWGWATWARAWRRFDGDGAALLRELRRRRAGHRFDLEGAYRFTRMLARQTRGLEQSWAIRWHASAFLADMYTLYPGRSLVDNIGFDGSGTNCGAWDAYRTSLSAEPIPVRRIAISEDQQARSLIARYHRRVLSWRGRMRCRVGVAAHRMLDALGRRERPGTPDRVF